jgi:ATP-dependent Clp protease ATP-binding subunit ClpC
MSDGWFGPGSNPFDDLVGLLFGGVGGPGRPASPRHRVDRFGRDLTAAAREGRLDPVVGRDDEVERVLEVLSRKTKNNPVLIGDPGVGKTAIVEGIAQRVAKGEVPVTLKGRRLVALDLAGMVAGTKYRGEFEERLQGVIEEVTAAKRMVVLFIDELHTLVGAGAGEGGAMDAGNMLKPALASGELQLIGATTVEEYRRHIEKDLALERRFQPILVAEPSVQETISILHGVRGRYETHHMVRIADESNIAAAELSARYINDRFLPDKAIDVIDQACARVRLRASTPPDRTATLEQQVEQLAQQKESALADEDYERAEILSEQLDCAIVALDAARTGPARAPQVTADDIAEVISRSTGVPVAQLTQAERQRLLLLEEHLHKRIIGQDDAVEAVADAVRQGRVGLKHPNRPVGSFLFLGPTGVGKTELARALAEALFGEENRLIRFDMSEFQEKHTVSRLTGAPPGYVGYEDAGQLTGAVRRTPYTVLLLDEIEKAHSDVFNSLLQVLDAGRLTDSHGRSADFSNAVIIMTSNVGADQLLAVTTSGHSVEEVREPLMAKVRQHFRPEFVDRLDETVLFRGLDRPQLRQISKLLLEQTRDRLRAQNIALVVDDQAIDWLTDRGYRPEFGARPLRRTIGRELDKQLARALLTGDLHSGQQVVVNVTDDHLNLSVNDQPTPDP